MTRNILFSSVLYSTLLSYQLDFISLSIIFNRVFPSNIFLIVSLNFSFFFFIVIDISVINEGYIREREKKKNRTTRDNLFCSNKD